VQASTPPPLRHSIGYTDRGGWEERTEKKKRRREKGAKVEEGDEVMKNGSDDAGSDWGPYEDLSSYEVEDEAPVALTKIQAAPHPAAKKPLAKNPGQQRQPPRTSLLAIPEPRGW